MCELPQLMLCCVMTAQAPLSEHRTVELWQGESRRRCCCCCSLQVYSSWRALECVVLLGVHISSPPSQRWRKQRRPRFCKPWLQSLGCTGAPGVTGPLLEGIQLAKCRRSPVFNNNHLKSLQLACSYKEMESKKMWRGREGGGGGLRAHMQWTFRMSAPLSHGKFKRAFVLINY